MDSEITPDTYWVGQTIDLNYGGHKVGTATIKQVTDQAVYFEPHLDDTPEAKASAWFFQHQVQFDGLICMALGDSHEG